MSDCLFCKIARGEIPCKKVWEDENLLAFHDIAPQAPVHFLVIPKRHIANLMELDSSDNELMGSLLFAGQRLAKELGLEERGARFVLNCKADAQQSGGRAQQKPRKDLRVHEVLGG